MGSVLLVEETGVPGESLRPTVKEFEDTKGYYNQYFEQEQTTQWLKEKVQKGKQRSTKHTQTCYTAKTGIVIL